MFNEMNYSECNAFTGQRYCFKIWVQQNKLNFSSLPLKGNVFDFKKNILIFSYLIFFSYNSKQSFVHYCDPKQSLGSRFGA